jgi:hypothetical protein
MLNFDVHAFVRGRTCRAALIAGGPDRPMIRRNKRLTPWDSIFQTPACASFGEALLKMRSHDSTRLHLPAWGVTAKSDFQDAVVGLFLRRNKSFATMSGFEFNRDVRFSVRSFLARFDAIFSRNQ